MANVHIKRAAIPRAGYEYQDLVGIEILIRHYRDPGLYAWVKIEADDSEYRALDDIVAARKDGSYELVQVKFTVDAEQYELDWDWLLAANKNGASILGKWANSFTRVAAMGPIHSASLRTNRIPTAKFARCLTHGRVDLDLLPKDIRELAEVACGGPAEAQMFFSAFEFLGALPDLDQYESYLRDQLVPTDTDSLGWLAFREAVRCWAIYKNRPEPNGHILREHVFQLITKRRPQPIRQDFIVPNDYAVPSELFHVSIRKRIATDENPITIIWGTPGRGKSTYLSYLTHELQRDGAAVTRHHYFLSAEDSNSNRTSFIEISTSLVDQLCVRHSDVMAGVIEDKPLRSVIKLAADNLAVKGQRLYIIVDGLDHVWRDTQRVDQLNHLFNELLPLPKNVSLIVGTQRVSDEQLPGRLLVIAGDDDWFEIPRMDEVAVHRWVTQQDEACPLILRFDPTPEGRAEEIDEISRAFFNISQGHPLHLIYAFKAVIRAGRPVSSEEIELLPPCPNGDIRVYYRGLWVRLSVDAKNALHMLSGSDFFWPSIGIRRVLGGFNEIDYLLESRNVGMVPFHPSIFAWVRELSNHAECYQSLLPKIIHWLTSDAPEYWRWGWLWLAKAQAGDFNALLIGTTRDWVVESLTKGWPDQQIENILAAAEAKTFEDGDLVRTVSLRSLKTRVSNAREFQARDFAAYRATALAVSNNCQQILNLLDEIHDLTDSEVAELARHTPKEMASQILLACCDELSRRINVWITLRHRPAQEFTKLSDQFLAVSALMDEKMVKRAVKYIRQYKIPQPHILKLIHQLDAAQNIKGLHLVHKLLRGTKWESHRRLLNDALIRAASLAGADVRKLVRVRSDCLSAFAACWFLWRDYDVKLTIHVPLVLRSITRQVYLEGEHEDIASFFYDEFWIALYVGLCAKGRKYAMVPHGLAEEDLGWLPQGLAKLEQIARGIAEGQLAPTFAVIYTRAADILPVRWEAASKREYQQYCAFSEAMRRIAVDLHFLGLSDPNNPKVAASELNSARQSVHWSDEMWVIRNVNNRIPLLDKDGSAALLTDEADALSTKVTEFGERSERWTQLADLALLYGDKRQAKFLSRAAECLIGYGWRKDLSALDVLDATVELSARDPGVTRARLDTLAPIIEVITEFTDGDETNHVISKFIEVVAKVAPERLPCLYEHHLSFDSYSYADECLIEFAKIMDLECPAGTALARTFLDSRTLRVLEDRAVNEPNARALLDKQNTFLGRSQKINLEVTPTEEKGSRLEKDISSINPSSFCCDEFSTLINEIDAVHYDFREELMAKWLQHWSDEGKALLALDSVLSYFKTNETTYGGEKILDHAFHVSLANEGKDAAYRWLVKAHIYRNGWQSYYTSEREIMERIRCAAHYYPDRWLQYIRDTSVPAPFFGRRGYKFVLGRKYLVRFLVLVGQTDIADKITSALVQTLVEEVREQPIPQTPWFH